MSDGIFRFEPFQPADAEKVSRLFMDVYGDDYPIKMVYDPEKLVSAYESGLYFPFLVRTESNRIIAFGALYQSAPYKGIYEYVQGIVASDFRRAGLGRLMFEHVLEYIQTLPGAETYFAEAVCSHAHSQKSGSIINTVETGVEIDLMPGETYKKDAATGRVALLDMFRTFVPRPHKIYLPEIYEEIIRYIYNGFDDSRIMALSTPNPPSEQPTEMSIKVFESAGVARIAVSISGFDFDRVLTVHENALIKQKITVIQVWLNLSSPWIGNSVDLLRKKGYFFGGVFPRWFDMDGLLMQKVFGLPNWEGINLFSDRAKKICNYIHNDWESGRHCPVGKRLLNST